LGSGPLDIIYVRLGLVESAIGHIYTTENFSLVNWTKWTLSTNDWSIKGGWMRCWTSV